MVILNLNLRMKILKATKHKLIPTSEQSQKCASYAGQNRLVYNVALEQRNLVYSLYKKSVRWVSQDKELPELKEAFPFLRESPSQTLQQSLQDLHKAFNNFYRGTAKYPTHRRKFVNDSFRFPNPKEFNIQRVTNKKFQINLPKLGNCKFWTHKKLKNKEPLEYGSPKSATVKKEAGIWYISILWEINIKEEDASAQLTPENARSATALDRGCNNLLALPSPGLYKNQTPQANHLYNIVDYPDDMFSPYYGCLAGLKTKILEKYGSKIIKKQRILSLKTKGSRAFNKLKSQISKLHRKLKNYRLDVLHQLSTMIVENQDIIFLESLDVQAMTKSNKGTLENPGTDVKKKSWLNKFILQQGWGYLRIFLKYKSKWKGKIFHDDVPAYHTSTTCYSCGYRDEDNRKGDEFLCLRCHHSDHADVNAAKNILRDGLSRIASEFDQQRLLEFLGTTLQSSTA